MAALIYKDMFTGRWRRIAELPRKEAAFQIELVELLRWIVRPDVIWRHVPNGEHRDVRTAAKLKAMGVLAGCADLEFHWVELDSLKRKCRRALHLELKLGNRPQSEAQAGYELAMRRLGDEYHVVRSIDDAVRILSASGLVRADIAT